MKCNKCNKENTYKANYCMYCGNEFSKKEKESANDKSLYTKVSDVKDKVNLISNSKLSDNIYYNIIVTILTLVSGIYLWYINGDNIKINESTEYTVSYNENLNEYYVTTNLDYVPLSLYTPGNYENINIKRIDTNGNTLSNNDYEDASFIELEPFDNESYYIVSVSYKKKDSKEIKLYVYREV